MSQRAHKWCHQNNRKWQFTICSSTCLHTKHTHANQHATRGSDVWEVRHCCTQLSRSWDTDPNTQTHCEHYCFPVHYQPLLTRLLWNTLARLFEASVRAVANYGMRKNSPKVSKAGMCNHPTHTPCDHTSDGVITTRLKASLCWFTSDTEADDKNNSP